MFEMHGQDKLTTLKAYLSLVAKRRLIDLNAVDFPNTLMTAIIKINSLAPAKREFLIFVVYAVTLGLGVFTLHSGIAKAIEWGFHRLHGVISYSDL